MLIYADINMQHVRFWKHIFVYIHIYVTEISKNKQNNKHEFTVFLSVSSWKKAAQGRWTLPVEKLS